MFILFISDECVICQRTVGAGARCEDECALRAHDDCRNDHFFGQNDLRCQNCRIIGVGYHMENHDFRPVSNFIFQSLLFH